MSQIIKIVLIVLLFWCLLYMPYGYYELVRFLSFMIFTYLGLVEFKKSQTNGFIYLGLALLFQPFFKVSLGREIWNIIDIIVAIGLITTLINKNK